MDVLHTLMQTDMDAIAREVYMLLCDLRRCTLACVPPSSLQSWKRPMVLWNRCNCMCNLSQPFTFIHFWGLCRQTLSPRWCVFEMFVPWPLTGRILQQSQLLKRPSSWPPNSVGDDALYLRRGCAKLVGTRQAREYACLRRSAIEVENHREHHAFRVQFDLGYARTRQTNCWGRWSELCQCPM